MPSARPSDLHHRLVFQPDNYVDLELLDKNRTLIHSEKLFYESEPGAEALVLLFDHYLSLDLLSIVSSVGPPVALRRKSFFSKFSSRKSAEPDASEHALYPLTLKSSGKLDNEFTLYAESASLRTGWALKLEEALALRRAFRDENPVFEMAQVNSNKFSAPIGDQPKGAPWNPDNPITGLITCSTSFVAPNGKLFIAVCCAQGVWFGHHNDSDSFRQVLRLKDVLKCAVLEEFGVIVVLAEKSLFAYHIDALIPGFTHESRSLLAYKLNGKVDVEYFTVGRDLGRTFVIYMKKKGSDSVFRFLEPIPFNIKQGVPTNPNVNSDWFRKYKEFFAMQKTFGAQLIGLDPKILSAGILSAKGIEIHELSEYVCKRRSLWEIVFTPISRFSSTTIPVLDSAPSEMTKRCKSARVMGLFRSGEREQLICYDSKSLHSSTDTGGLRANASLSGKEQRKMSHTMRLISFFSMQISLKSAMLLPGSLLKSYQQPTSDACVMGKELNGAR
ncbi:hypothetical protein DXG01_008251 [Tephrocybe rancida]|nr:hypothetical protein DXG01_008251 [Tephrocybe rancida]